MAKRNFVIFAESAGWRVATPAARGASDPIEIMNVSSPANASFEERGAALAEALNAAGYFGGGSAVLALRSGDCLCASIRTHDLPARHRGQAMIYRFEEKLPVSAEEIVADFVPGDASSLAIGVEKRLLQPLVAAVEAAGLRVRAICP